MSSGEPELTKAHARLQAQISSRATPRFELLLQNRNTLFSFFMKSFLILFEKQQPGDAPAKDVIKIRHVADMERNRYEVWLSTLSEMERYA